MGGKGGEILLDRLVVADVCQHGVKHWNFGAIGGNRKSGLGHERQQACSFQGYGFSAGVWASDDQLAAVAFELYADRDYRETFRFQISFEQMMPCVMQQQASCARRTAEAAAPTWLLLSLNMVAGQLCFYAVVIFGEPGLGELQFQFLQSILRGADLFSPCADALGHLEQNAMDFAQFFFQEPYEFVVLLDRLQ